MQEVVLRTGVWYNDHSLKLSFPDSWDVKNYRPNTPAPLSETQLIEKINSPVGQPPLSELARGKTRAVIVTDDLSRPTPVHRIMPLVLDQFRQAGVDLQSLRILVAAGTHGKQNPGALKTKLGRECFDSCQVLIHSDKKHTKLIGDTSFGTPVHVDRELIDSDLIVGISGIYPQYTTGFGGGGKLALGVLGRKSISHLHFNSGDNDGDYNIDNNFRRNVTEMCRMIGLNTIFSVHPDAELQIVNLTCGDHYSYYAEAAKFSREVYNAPPPHDADIVIANGYPSDISYTFMRKGNRPILVATKNAIKIMIGSNPEGLGNHGLYPQGKSDRYLEFKATFDRIKIMEPKVIVRKVIKNLPLLKKKSAPPAVSGTVQESDSLVNNKPLWVYNPGAISGPMPPINGVRFFSNWEKVLELAGSEFSNRTDIRVRIYPCAPLQCIDSRKPLSSGSRTE